ncbi:MAG: TIGR03663 family protein [Chloroflexia bacterium]|nr:TIGR03663 family protein [Chloroflexia bacterium]
MDTMPSTSPSSSSRPGRHCGPTIEIALYALLLLLAIMSRFALLDSQALHHDEGIHALYGWNIYQDKGYVHDAVYHGPFIYHAGALSFYLFGDNDVTARLMPALFSIATVMLPALLRRQLGRWGALLASFLLLISPSFLYFGRFVRNDVFGAFWTLLLFVCIVRYLSERRNGWLYGAAVATSLYFCTKETAYITVATFGLFLVGRILWQRYGLHAFWPLLGLFPAAIEDLWRRLSPAAPTPLLPLGEGLEATPPLTLSWFSLLPLALAGLGLLAMLAWAWWQARRESQPDPSLDLVVVLGTMALPLLSAIPLNLLVSWRGLEPVDYHSPNIPAQVIFLAVIAIGLCFALAAVIGLLWDSRRWLVALGLFWSIFFVLHTSFFTSMTGWATGLVQALGFWLSQQGVKRIHVGPQYYLVLMPVYELISVVFGTLGMFFFAWRGLLQAPRTKRVPAAEEEGGPPPPPLGAPFGPAAGLLVWWAPVGLVVYSLAGEQVPWLNVHPTLPFLLLAAALLGRVMDYRPRSPQRPTRQRWADLSLFVVSGLLLLWAGRPFWQGTVPGTGSVSTPLLGLIWLIVAALLLGAAALAFGALPVRCRGNLALAGLGLVAAAMTAIGASRLSFQQGYADWWTIYVPLALLVVALLARLLLLGRVAWRGAALLLFVLLAAYSLSSAWRVAYIYNDTPLEMLVYVQTGSDAQWAMDQLEALSTLTTGGRDIVFLYDSEVAWPMEWYFRNYPRKVYQGTISGPPADAAALAMVYRDKDNTSGPYLERRFYPIRYYIFNWWFPEDIYRSARGFVQRAAPDLLSETAADEGGWRLLRRALAQPSAQARLWRYFLYRELPAGLGAREFAFYIRRDLLGSLHLLQDSIPRR